MDSSIERFNKKEKKREEMKERRETKRLRNGSKQLLEYTEDSRFKRVDFCDKRGNCIVTKGGK